MTDRKGYEFNRAWLEFSAFLVMGGFLIENLGTEAMQQRFRESQRRVIEAIRRAAPSDPPKDAQAVIADFRREVRDKLAVAAHCGPDAPLKGRARDVLKQCEDFLVEQFESAIGETRQQPESYWLTGETRHAHVFPPPEEQERCPPAEPPSEVQAVIAKWQSSQWPIQDVLRKLSIAATHLLRDHGCDAHGYEGVTYARDRAIEMAGELEAALATPRPRQSVAPAASMNDQPAWVIKAIANATVLIDLEAHRHESEHPCVSCTLSTLLRLSNGCARCVTPADIGGFSRRMRSRTQLRAARSNKA